MFLFETWDVFLITLANSMHVSSLMSSATDPSNFDPTILKMYLYQTRKFLFCEYAHDSSVGPECGQIQIPQA
jgi:hypothetical protein